MENYNIKRKILLEERDIPWEDPIDQINALIEYEQFAHGHKEDNFNKDLAWETIEYILNS